MAVLQNSNGTNISYTTFSRYSFVQAREDLKAYDRDGESRVNRKFYDGDHWQGGRQWTGPVPRKPDVRSSEIMSEIQRMFVSQNVLKEIVDRFVTGMLGNEPIWRLRLRRQLKDGEDPTEAEQALIAEAEDALSTWFDRRNVRRILKRALSQALLSARGPLRMYIPRGKILDDGSVGTQEVASALLNLVWIEDQLPNVAAEVENPDTKERAGVFLTKVGNVDTLEISYVDEARGLRPTVVRVFTLAASNEKPIEELEIPLDGHVLVHEIQVDRLVTPQMRQAQCQINMALTMMQRNAILGGFLERVFLNAEVPVVSKDVPGPDGTTVTKNVPDPDFAVGGGIATFLSGKKIMDDQGNVTGYANPSAYYRDPVDPENFIKTVDVARLNMLREARQIHVEMAKDATASGVSRVQARADFASSLYDAKPDIDGALRWLLSVGLALLSYLTKKPEYIDQLTPAADVRPNAGPLDAEEKKALLEMWDRADPLISKESLMQLLGVSDVDNELDKIREDVKKRPFSFEDARNVGYVLPEDRYPEFETRLQYEQPSTPADVQTRQDAETEQRNLLAQRVAGSLNPPAPKPTNGKPKPDPARAE